ncbi:hypothetical protein CFOL_v3_09000 [Cephalotus follicularis]|uniref:Uncharacterized protein n=1 Tax=Cephalotus follicularis TaxID=3775 RepID=A0A1Q3BC67_CEPFO|nr:hypothetical protein CFOL_v3_09000 [Cephalotus follicularis]
MTSLVLKAGTHQGGLYLASTNFPITLYPSLSKLRFSFASFSFTTLSVAIPANFTTPYFLSPSSVITTLSSTGLGASSAFRYLEGNRNCMVTVFFSSPSPLFVTTGTVIAIFSLSEDLVMTGAVIAIFLLSEDLVITGAVIAIFSGLMFLGLPDTPIYSAKRAKPPSLSPL